MLYFPTLWVGLGWCWGWVLAFFFGWGVSRRSRCCTRGPNDPNGRCTRVGDGVFNGHGPAVGAAFIPRATHLTGRTGGAVDL